MIPTTNIIQRTFFIRQGSSIATAFAIETDGREYLITARHVVPDRSNPIDVLHDEKWKRLPVTGIYHHTGKPDVAAITLGQQLSPRHPVELSTSGTAIGQGVAFLGFPFGWNNTQFDFNNGYPIPFVKAAILSAFIFKDSTVTAYLDGHNNRGFSGGPIAADQMPNGGPQQSPKIIGIVSGFQNERTPHPREIDPPLQYIDGFPIAEDHVHLTNSGFILGYGINHAIEVVQANPYGFDLST